MFPVYTTSLLYRSRVHEYLAYVDTGSIYLSVFYIDRIDSCFIGVYISIEYSFEPVLRLLEKIKTANLTGYSGTTFD